MAMLAELVEVVIGVDTHKHTHTAAVVAAATGAVLDAGDRAGRPRPATGSCCSWPSQHHGQRVWAIEGTGGYGAGLTRFLQLHAEQVVELDRPKRPARRHGAKSDPLDADPRRPRGPGPRPARPAPSRPASGRRCRCGWPPAAPRSRPPPTPNASCTPWSSPPPTRSASPAPRPDHPRLVSHLRPAAAAGRLGRRDHRHRGQPARPWPAASSSWTPRPPTTRRAITTLVRAWRPDLLTRTGVGPIVAATVLCAWSHPGRCRNDAAFAMLGGAAPIPASSGQTVRVRLNRSGDRQLNQALHTVVLTRLRYDPAHPRLRPPPPRRGQDQPRDQTLPGPLRRPPALPTPRSPTRALTQHRSVRQNDQLSKRRRCPTARSRRARARPQGQSDLLDKQVG